MAEKKYDKAQRELEMYFAAADSILGLHGSGFEPGASAVWDAPRCNALHERMLHKSFGRTFCSCRTKNRPCDHGELRELAEITPTILALPREHWTTAPITFTPRGWPRYVAELLSRGERGGSFVGLALSGDPLRNAYVRRFKAIPSTLMLLAFAEREAEPQKEGEGRTRQFFAPIRKDAERRLEKALAAYDVLMGQRRRIRVESRRLEAAS